MPDIVGFNDHVRPILAQNCSACHGGVKKSGGISWVFEEEAITTGTSGKPSIVPGDADASYIIEKVTSTDPAVRMPPPEHGPALTERQVALLEKWIEQGAHWEEHWAFMAPEPVKTPEINAETWSRNEIDLFILDRLQQEGLSPNPQAQKGTLLRRVTLDLTGVPPTKAELDAFLADTSDDAYEKVVDRLLQSPHFGERWASMWLDLARYADSKGLGQDGRRPTIYKYRDWVIQAFNQDMPFDEFTIKQIAGDLLPNATLDDYVATAFHRNTSSDDEGGTSDEEFRIVAQMDRVNTTWQVWHGTTMACVQCHSHPYDPLRHDEYFQFMDFFNNTQDGDLAAEYPHIKVPKDPELQQKLNPLISQKRELQESLWRITAKLTAETKWHWLSEMQSNTNRDNQLQYNFQKVNGREEFLFDGTPTRVHQTITAPAPEVQHPLHALRLEVRPDDLESAPAAASPGFRLDQIKITLISQDGTQTPIDIDAIFRDEPFPFLWANPSGGTGFSALNYIFHDRWAVFRFKEAVTVEPGDQIKIFLNHGANVGRKDLLLIRRGAIALTGDARWRAVTQQEDYVAQNQKLKELHQQLSQGDQISVPVMVERPEHLRRVTKTFVRGNWTDLGEVQPAAVPASFHSLPDTGEPKRLQMARWLVDDHNPLAARVLVSRFWEQLFGIGIVETLEDFGSVGLPPSHPELLDYMALKLMHDFDWSMKSLLRYIVTSAAYRQDNTSTPELNALDPKNRLLSRGPRVRLTGEMIRDQVLALGGVLNTKMYGPAVMPQQPEGGWTPSHGSAGDWVESSQADSDRRSIYVHWQRSSVYPVFTAFDAPARELCSDRRIQSNTPLQPLFTLNDPALFQASQAFGERMLQHEGDLATQISYGYELATCKTIPEIKLQKLIQLHGEVMKMYPENEAAMRAAWDQEVERRVEEKRYLIRKQNNQKKARARQKKQPEPTDLPDPMSIQRSPEDEFDYSAERAAFDNIATVILNMDTVLNK
ncbi:MAG: PSD1 and planctomycete cytochrome C domain-containing protein [Verrucomicrobiota bacterium]